MTALQDASLAVIYVSTGVIWIFIMLYQVITKGMWRRSNMGLHLMCMAGADAIIFTLLTVSALWPWLGTKIWFQWAYVVAVSMIPVVTIWRAWILVDLYRRKN